MDFLRIVDGGIFVGSNFLTSGQVIVIATTIIALAIALIMAKKIMKLVVVAIVIITAAVNFGVVSPEQIGDVTSIVAEYGKEAIDEIAKQSENIEISTEDAELIVKIYDGKQWRTINDISAFNINNEHDSVEIMFIDGSTAVIQDVWVIKIIEMFKA